MTTSPDFGLPYIAESQAQPEVTHNEALNLIQSLLIGVIDRGVNTPAVGPTIGDTYIVGTAPTGAWAGRANTVTIWTGTAWDFIPGEDSSGTPITMGARQEGMRVWVKDEDAVYYWSGSAWTLFTATIADNSVTNAKLADMATQTIKGRTTAGTGDPEDLTATQARTVLGLATTDSPTFTALTLTDGQIVFPSTQVPSANANTLDDYEEGTWTPVLTFATPGDLSVTYSAQVGTYVKIGKLATMSWNIVTSAFTHTTASGGCRITGLPFTSASNNVGSLEWQGVTKALYTNLMPLVTTATALINIVASGSGQAAASITAADMPTGGSVLYRGSIPIEV